MKSKGNSAETPKIEAMASKDRSTYPVRKIRLQDEGADDALSSLTPSERVAMVRQLTLQAWAFKEGRWVEPRLRRDTVLTVRGRG
jgi:hypothetical protein